MPINTAATTAPMWRHAVRTGRARLFLAAQLIMRTLFKALMLVGSIALHGSFVPADAQVRGLGRLNGVVLDASGAPVDGVTIETKTMDGVAIKATTAADGKWVGAGLGKGMWEVDFVKDGVVRVKAKVTIATELARTEPIKITLKKA